MEGGTKCDKGGLVVMELRVKRINKKIKKMEGRERVYGLRKRVGSERKRVCG